MDIINWNFALGTLYDSCITVSCTCDRLKYSFHFHKIAVKGVTSLRLYSDRRTLESVRLKNKPDVT